MMYDISNVSIVAPVPVLIPLILSYSSAPLLLYSLVPYSPNFLRWPDRRDADRYAAGGATSAQHWRSLHAHVLRSAGSFLSRGVEYRCVHRHQCHLTICAYEKIRGGGQGPGLLVDSRVAAALREVPETPLGGDDRQTAAQGSPLHARL
jgi:hypothetical protein